MRSAEDQEKERSMEGERRRGDYCVAGAEGEQEPITNSARGVSSTSDAVPSSTLFCDSHTQENSFQRHQRQHQGLEQNKFVSSSKSSFDNQEDMDTFYLPNSQSSQEYQQKTKESLIAHENWSSRAYDTNYEESVSPNTASFYPGDYDPETFIGNSKNFEELDESFVDVDKEDCKLRRDRFLGRITSTSNDSTSSSAANQKMTTSNSASQFISRVEEPHIDEVREDVAIENNFYPSLQIETSSAEPEREPSTHATELGLETEERKYILPPKKEEEDDILSRQKIENALRLAIPDANFDYKRFSMELDIKDVANVLREIQQMSDAQQMMSQMSTDDYAIEQDNEFIKASSASAAYRSSSFSQTGDEVGDSYVTQRLESEESMQSEESRLSVVDIDTFRVPHTIHATSVSDVGTEDESVTSQDTTTIVGDEKYDVNDKKMQKLTLYGNDNLGEDPNVHMDREVELFENFQPEKEFDSYYSYSNSHNVNDQDFYSPHKFKICGSDNYSGTINNQEETDLLHDSYPLSEYHDSLKGVEVSGSVSGKFWNSQYYESEKTDEEENPIYENVYNILETQTTLYEKSNNPGSNPAPSVVPTQLKDANSGKDFNLFSTTYKDEETYEPSLSHENPTPRSFHESPNENPPNHDVNFRRDMNSKKTKSVDTVQFFSSMRNSLLNALQSTTDKTTEKIDTFSSNFNLKPKSTPKTFHSLSFESSGQYDSKNTKFESSFVPHFTENIAEKGVSNAGDSSLLDEGTSAVDISEKFESSAMMQRTGSPSFEAEYYPNARDQFFASVNYTPKSEASERNSSTNNVYGRDEERSQNSLTNHNASSIFLTNTYQFTSNEHSKESYDSAGSGNSSASKPRSPMASVSDNFDSIKSWNLQNDLIGAPSGGRTNIPTSKMPCTFASGHDDVDDGIYCATFGSELVEEEAGMHYSLHYEKDKKIVGKSCEDKEFMGKVKTTGCNLNVTASSFSLPFRFNSSSAHAETEYGEKRGNGSNRMEKGSKNTNYGGSTEKGSSEKKANNCEKSNNNSSGVILSRVSLCDGEKVETGDVQWGIDLTRAHVALYEETNGVNKRSNNKTHETLECEGSQLDAKGRGRAKGEEAVGKSGVLMETTIYSPQFPVVTCACCSITPSSNAAFLSGARENSRSNKKCNNCNVSRSCSISNSGNNSNYNNNIIPCNPQLQVSDNKENNKSNNNKEVNDHKQMFQPGALSADQFGGGRNRGATPDSMEKFGGDFEGKEEGLENLEGYSGRLYSSGKEEIETQKKENKNSKEGVDLKEKRNGVCKEVTNKLEMSMENERGNANQGGGYGNCSCCGAPSMPGKSWAANHALNFTSNFGIEENGGLSGGKKDDDKSSRIFPSLASPCSHLNRSLVEVSPSEQKIFKNIGISGSSTQHDFIASSSFASSDIPSAQSLKYPFPQVSSDSIAQNSSPLSSSAETKQLCCSSRQCGANRVNMDDSFEQTDQSDFGDGSLIAQELCRSQLYPDKEQEFSSQQSFSAISSSYIMKNNINDKNYATCLACSSCHAMTNDKFIHQLPSSANHVTTTTNPTMMASLTNKNQICGSTNLPSESFSCSCYTTKISTNHLSEKEKENVKKLSKSFEAKIKTITEDLSEIKKPACPYCNDRLEVISPGGEDIAGKSEPDCDTKTGRKDELMEGASTKNWKDISGSSQEKNKEEAHQLIHSPTCALFAIRSTQAHLDSYSSLVPTTTVYNNIYSLSSSPCFLSSPTVHSCTNKQTSPSQQRHPEFDSNQVPPHLSTTFSPVCRQLAVSPSSSQFQTTTNSTTNALSNFVFKYSSPSNEIATSFPSSSLIGHTTTPITSPSEHDSSLSENLLNMEVRSLTLDYVSAPAIVSSSSMTSLKRVSSVTSHSVMTCKPTSIPCYLTSNSSSLTNFIQAGTGPICLGKKVHRNLHESIKIYNERNTQKNPNFSRHVYIFLTHFDIMYIIVFVSDSKLLLRKD